VLSLIHIFLRLGILSPAWVLESTGNRPSPPGEDDSCQGYNLGGVDHGCSGSEVLRFPHLGRAVRLYTVHFGSIISSNRRVDRFEISSSNFTVADVSSCRAMRTADHFVERSV